MASLKPPDSSGRVSPYRSSNSPTRCRSLIKQSPRSPSPRAIAVLHGSSSLLANANFYYRLRLHVCYIPTGSLPKGEQSNRFPDVSIYLYLLTHRKSYDARLRPVFLGYWAQIISIGILGPIYFYIYYVFTLIEKSAASDFRLTNRAYSVDLLPSSLLLYCIPHFLSYFHPSLEVRH